MINASNLALPDAPEYLAKQAVVRLLKQAPILSGKLRTFLSYDGDDLDDAKPDDIPRPFLRLRVWPGPSGWFAAGQHQFPVSFSIELAVDGTGDRDILRLWNAVRIALSPGRPSPWQDQNPGQTVLNAMQDVGIAKMAFEESAFNIRNPGEGVNRYVHATAVVSAMILVNT